MILCGWMRLIDGLTLSSSKLRFGAGIDVTEAELVPQTTWRRQEKTEMVGPWKGRIYDMHHVQVGSLCSKL